MEANEQVQSVIDALDAAHRWAEEERVKMSSEIEEVEKEMANLEAAIDNLSQQHEALVRLHEELGMKAAAGASISEKYYESIFSALVVQAQAVADRVDMVQAAIASQRVALAAAMNTPEIAALQAECDQFTSTIEAGLDSLPESVREVVLSHHRSLESQLAEHRTQLEVDSVDIDVEELSLNLVYAVDPIAGEPELLTVVFPIAESVYVDWESRPETMLTHLASRIVQAIYQVCQDAGLEEPEGAFGGHQGLLAMEVDLAGASHELMGRIAEAVTTAVAIDPEFGSAKIRLEAVCVDMDHLLPPEEDDEDGES
jgi:predicted  nucleic acid-binding Zn-ribbon protein